MLIKKKAVKHNVKSSAKATAIQIPLIPNKIGSVITTIIWNTSVLKKEIVADIRPLFSAVKNEEPYILKPLTRNVRQ